MRIRHARRSADLARRILASSAPSVTVGWDVGDRSHHDDYPDARLSVAWTARNTISGMRGTRT
jgi:hypothetical protein